MRVRSKKKFVKQYMDELSGRAAILFENLVNAYEKQEKIIFPIIFGNGGAWCISLIIGIIFAWLIKKTAPIGVVISVGTVLTLCSLVMLAEIRNAGFMAAKKIAHFIFVAVFALIIFRFTYYLGNMRFFCICDILVGVISFFAIAGMATSNVKDNTEKVLFSILCNLFALAVELLIRWASGDDFFNIPLIVVHIFLGCMVGSVLYEKEA